jgi:Na+/H+ antiporter NhaC
LDIFSCVVQVILPYGAQMLVALAAISAALPDANVSAFDLIPYMFYPFLLLVSVLVFIAVSPRRNKE